MLAALQGCGENQTSGCGCSTSSGSLESQLRVWGNKEQPAGGGAVQQLFWPQQLEGGGLQLNSMLPPSGKIWVLQGMSVDGIAEGLSWETPLMECLFGLLGLILQMPREGRDLSPGHPGHKLGLGLTFRARHFPLSPVVLRKPPRGLREVEL